MTNESGFSRSKPKGFIWLLGAEHELMRKSGGNVLTKFYISAVLIVIIAIISFISIAYTIRLLFHQPILEFTLSAFLSLLFVLMYIFLINTFSSTSSKLRFNFSNVTRTAFIIFMAFMISRPLETYILKNLLTEHIATHKQKLAEDHTRKIEALYNVDLAKLNASYEYYARGNKDDIFKEEIDALTAKIHQIEEDKNQLISISQYRIEHGDYFVFRIRTLSSHYPFTWVICLVVIVLFLLPGFLVFSLSHSQRYFHLKEDLDRRLITQDFNSFLHKYSEIFQGKYKVQTQFYTNYLDPPFNTKRKPDHTYKQAKDFYAKYVTRQDGL